MQKLVNKADFLKCCKCPRLCWLDYKENYKYKNNWNILNKSSVDQDNNDEIETILDNKLGLDSEYGKQVGDLARKYFSLKYGKENCLNCELLSKSNECILKMPYKVFFEPLFKLNNALTRLDIFIKKDDGTFKLIEVKSTTSAKYEFALDIGYQLYILNKLDIKITECEIMYVNNKYVHDGINNYFSNFDKLDSFFKISDSLITSKNKQTKEKINDLYNKLFTYIENNINLAHKIINSKNLDFQKNIVAIPSKERCKKVNNKLCDFFSYCLVNYQNINLEKIKFSVYALKNSQDKNKYLNNNIFDINKIPDKDKKQYFLTDNQKIFNTHIKLVLDNKEIFIDKKEILKYVNNLKFPIYMLDFETVNYVIPQFKDAKPYQQIIFQYSIHIVNDLNDLKNCSEKNIIHREFFYDFYSNEIIYKQVIDNLYNDFKSLFDKNGTVMAYHKSFEISRIKELITYCKNNYLDKYIEILNFIILKIIDLKDIFAKHKYYYDVNFLSSFSIKSILPVLIPRFSYKNLKIQNGEQAIDEFKIIYEKFQNKKISKNILKNEINHFLKYCELDTLAMVLILKSIYLKSLF